MACRPSYEALGHGSYPPGTAGEMRWAEWEDLLLYPQPVHTGPAIHGCPCMVSFYGTRLRTGVAPLCLPAGHLLNTSLAKQFKKKKKQTESR
jgi:hypothetical protein